MSLTKGSAMATRHRSIASPTAEAPMEAAPLTLEQIDRILTQRAEALAIKAAEAPADAFEALVFELGQERYAFPNDQVREVRPLTAVTALGRTPAFIAGLTNVRGKVVPVLDLRSLFGVRDSSGSPTTLVLLQSPRGPVGLLASGQPAVYQLRTSELSVLPAGLPPGVDAGYVRGITPELIIVLDGQRLLADPRIIVQDD